MKETHHRHYLRLRDSCRVSWLIKRLGPTQSLPSILTWILLELDIIKSSRMCCVFVGVRGHNVVIVLTHPRREPCSVVEIRLTDSQKHGTSVTDRRKCRARGVILPHTQARLSQILLQVPAAADWIYQANTLKTPLKLLEPFTSLQYKSFEMTFTFGGLLSVRFYFRCGLVGDSMHAGMEWWWGNWSRCQNNLQSFG